MKTILTVFFALCSLQALTQEIGGTVLDEKKEPIINAEVRVFQNGILKGQAITDFDGNFTIKPLDIGQNDLVAFYPGFDTFKLLRVLVADNRTSVRITLRKAQGMPDVVIKAYKKPLIASDYKATTTSEIDTSLLKYSHPLPEYMHQNTGVYQNPHTASKIIAPIPSHTTQYIIDGIQTIQLVTLMPEQHCSITQYGRTHYLFTAEDIEQMPVTCIDDVLSLLPGTYQAKRGDRVSIYGSRTISNEYELDGMHLLLPN